MDQRTRVVTVACAKGGVMKTTTSMQLAGHLARRMRHDDEPVNVVVLDSDNTGGATRWATMTQFEKLLAKMRESPKSIRFSQLELVCEHYFGKPRSKGTSHHFYKTPWQGGVAGGMRTVNLPEYVRSEKGCGASSPSSSSSWIASLTMRWMPFSAALGVSSSQLRKGNSSAVPTYCPSSSDHWTR